MARSNWVSLNDKIVSFSLTEYFNLLSQNRKELIILDYSSIKPPAPTIRTGKETIPEAIAYRHFFEGSLLSCVGNFQWKMHQVCHVVIDFYY